MSPRELTNNELVDLGTGIVGAANLNDYLDVVSTWIPRVCTADHASFVVSAPGKGFNLVHMSAGFPAEILPGRGAPAAGAIPIVGIGPRSKPGDVVHLGTLRNRCESTDDWNAVVRELRRGRDVVDSLAVHVHVSPDLDWGAALTLWRARPAPPFGAREVETVRNLGRVLAAGFLGAWKEPPGPGERGPKTEAIFREANVSFAVGPDGAPADPDAIPDGFFTEERCAAGVPAGISTVLGGLARFLESDASLSVASMDATVGRDALRVYLSRSEAGPGAPADFRAALMLKPDPAVPGLLLRRGSNQTEIETLSLLQKGLGPARIAAEMGVTENTVRFRLREIGRRLGIADGAGIVAAAIALGRKACDHAGEPR